MKDTQTIGSIFELLKIIRIDAMKNRKWGVLKAVEKAENAAMAEILGLDLSGKAPVRGQHEILTYSAKDRKLHS